MVTVDKERMREQIRFSPGKVRQDGDEIVLTIEATVPAGSVYRRIKRHAKQPSKSAYEVLWSLIKTDSDPLRHMVLIRALRAIDKVIEQASVSELEMAGSEPDDFKAITKALQSQSALSITDDPLAAAKLRGAEMQRALLDEHKSLSSETVARVLKISRQAVDKRRKAGALLGLRIGRGYRYPAFQLEDGEELTGLKETLRLLNGLGDWTQFNFLVSPDESLGGKSPIQVLRKGNPEKVWRLAKGYGHQSAS